MARGCPILTKLDLNGCKKIIDVKVHATIDDDEVDPLIGCPGLTSLNLSGTTISDIKVQALAVSCPELTMLSLCDCAKITDVRVQALASSCPELLSLNLSVTAISAGFGHRALSSQR